MLGVPPAASKQVDMTHEADYVGLMHNVAAACPKGEMELIPRTMLLEKAR